MYNNWSIHKVQGKWGVFNISPNITTADEWVGKKNLNFCYWCDEEENNTLVIRNIHAPSVLF